MHKVSFSKIDRTSMSSLPLHEHSFYALSLLLLVPNCTRREVGLSWSTNRRSLRNTTCHIDGKKWALMVEKLKTCISHPFIVRSRSRIKYSAARAPEASALQKSPGRDISHGNLFAICDGLILSVLGSQKTGRAVWRARDGTCLYLNLNDKVSSYGLIVNSCMMDSICLEHPCGD